MIQVLVAALMAVPVMAHAKEAAPTIRNDVACDAVMQMTYNHTEALKRIAPRPLTKHELELLGSRLNVVMKHHPACWGHVDPDVPTYNELDEAWLYFVAHILRKD